MSGDLFTFSSVSAGIVWNAAFVHSFVASSFPCPVPPAPSIVQLPHCTFRQVPPPTVVGIPFLYHKRTTPCPLFLKPTFSLMATKRAWVRLLQVSQSLLPWDSRYQFPELPRISCVLMFRLIVPSCWCSKSPGEVWRGAALLQATSLDPFARSMTLRSVWCPT